VLAVGKDGWPFPIPLVKETQAGASTPRGKEEILNRRIGANELYTMQAALAYADAQRDYYVMNPQKDKLLQYAQKFSSAQGKRDGLYYPTKAGEPRSPLGPLFDKAKAAGYRERRRLPRGYQRTRSSSAQGPDATGGAYDYVAQGTHDRRLRACRLAHDHTGNQSVMTFMVSARRRGLREGPRAGTAAQAEKITWFNARQDLEEAN
jgi:hypothetical protein